jgi:hypothetical protein
MSSEVPVAKCDRGHFYVKQHHHLLTLAHQRSWQAGIEEWTLHKLRRRHCHMEKVSGRTDSLRACDG